MHGTRTVAAAAAALVTATALLTGCTSDPSQDEIAERCIKAVNALDEPPHKDDPKPETCEGINDENWTLIIMGRTLDDIGVDADGDGEITEEDLLEFGDQ